jgi:hypothetical protein
MGQLHVAVDDARLDVNLEPVRREPAHASIATDTVRGDERQCEDDRRGKRGTVRGDTTVDGRGAVDRRHRCGDVLIITLGVARCLREVVALQPTRAHTISHSTVAHTTALLRQRQTATAAIHGKTTRPPQ